MQLFESSLSAAGWMQVIIYTTMLIFTSMRRTANAFVMPSFKKNCVTNFGGISENCSPFRQHSIYSATSTDSDVSSPEIQDGVPKATSYPFAQVETKWQAYWEENNTFKTPVRDTSKPKNMFWICSHTLPELDFMLVIQRAIQLPILWPATGE